MWALPTGTPQHPTPGGPNGYNGSLTPVANLTGGCNFTCDTPIPFPQGKPPPGPAGGCPTMSQCGYDDPDLIHSWTAVTPSTVKQISAVCCESSCGLTRPSHHAVVRPLLLCL